MNVSNDESLEAHVARRDKQEPGTEVSIEVAEPRDPDVNFRAITALAIYNVVLGSAIVILVVSMLSGGFSSLIFADSASLQERVAGFMVFMACGAALGSILHSLYALFLHGLVLSDFQPRFYGSYILGPFAAALLGVGLFVIFQGGLLVISEGTPTGSGLVRATMFYAGLGVLTGFAYDAVLVRIDGVARQIFGAQHQTFLQRTMERVEEKHEKQGP